MLGPKLNFQIFFINYKGGKKGRASMLLFSGVPNLSKKIDDGPIKVASSKE
jgi:hypothetical protein